MSGPTECAAECSIINDGFQRVQPNDAFISFRTYPSENPATPSGRHTGRVLSAAPGRRIVVSTPVTLCPGEQYRFSASSRQADIDAQCSISYGIGDNTIFTARPQEAWLAQPRSEFYTAGNTPETVSVDVSVAVTYSGQGGAPVGTDEAGFLYVFPS